MTNQRLIRLLQKTIKVVQSHFIEIIVGLGIIVFLGLMTFYQMNPYGKVATFTIQILRLEWSTRSLSACLLICFVMLAWMWQLPIAFYLRYRQSVNLTFDEMLGLKSIAVSRRALWLWFAIIAASFLFLKAYPYLRYDTPIGIDTGSHLLALRILEKETGTALSGINLGPSISYGFTFAPLIPLRAFGLSWETIVALFPLVVGMLYIISNYLFAKANAGEVIGLLAAMFSALSLNTQLLTGVTYRNAMGLSLLMLFLLSYLRYINHIERRDLMFTAILFLWLLLQYPYMAMIVFPIIFLFMVITFSLNHRDSAKTLLRNMCLPLTVPLITVLVSSVVVTVGVVGRGGLLDFPGFVDYVLSRYGSSHGPGQLTPSFWISLYGRPFYSHFVDSPLVLLLASMGIFMLLTFIPREQKTVHFRNILFSWYIVVFLTFIFNPSEGYRQVVNYPLPIFSAIGLAFLLRVLPKLKS